MTSDQRTAILRLKSEGLSPAKIGLMLGISDFSVRYVIDHKGERAKNKERVGKWRAARRLACRGVSSHVSS